MSRPMLAAMPLVLLGACQTIAPSPVPDPILGACTPDNLNRLNGLKRSAEVERTAKRASGARIVRWVAPGEMVTMDFRTDRLTLEVDTNGRITGARCG